VLSESGGNGIGKKAQRKGETPTEKGINRASNQQDKIKQGDWGRCWARGKESTEEK